MTQEEIDDQYDNNIVAKFMLRNEPEAHEVATVLADDGFQGRWFELTQIARHLCA